MSDQEPFGWLYESKAGVRIFHFVSDNEPLVQADWEAAQQYPEAHKMTPLYAHPPQRKPLTEVEIYKMFGWYAMPFVRAVEKAHGIGDKE